MAQDTHRKTHIKARLLKSFFFYSAAVIQVYKKKKQDGSVVEVYSSFI